MDGKAILNALLRPDGEETMPKAERRDREFHSICEKTDIHQLAEAVERTFDQSADPRLVNRWFYPAWYLLLILMMASIVGEGTMQDICAWARCNHEWLRQIRYVLKKSGQQVRRSLSYWVDPSGRRTSRKMLWEMASRPLSC